MASLCKIQRQAQDDVRDTPRIRSDAHRRDARHSAHSAAQHVAALRHLVTRLCLLDDLQAGARGGSSRELHTGTSVRQDSDGPLDGPTDMLPRPAKTATKRPRNNGAGSPSRTHWAARLCALAAQQRVPLAANSVAGEQQCAAQCHRQAARRHAPLSTAQHRQLSPLQLAPCRAQPPPWHPQQRPPRRAWQPALKRGGKAGVAGAHNGAVGGWGGVGGGGASPSRDAVSSQPPLPAAHRQPAPLPFEQHGGAQAASRRGKQHPTSRRRAT